MIGKILIVTFALASVVVGGRCPRKCFCAPKTGVVDCRSAALSSVPGDLPRPLSIKQLLLSRNVISDIGTELLKYENLEKLDLTGNRLINISGNAFSALRGLKTLILKKNVLTDVTSVTFTGLNSLEILDLSDNFLTDIDSIVFRNLKQLKSLLLSHNNIFSLHPFAFYGMKSLTNLDLKGNVFEDLPMHSISKIKSLQSLFLTGNKIKKIDTRSFMMMDNLEKLELDDNEIQFISPYAFHNDMESDIPKLTYLSLKNNVLEVIPSKALRKLSKLQYLDLSGNLFTLIPPDSFHDLSRLQYLYLNDLVGLKTIDNYAMDGLQTLVELQVQNCHNLKSIEALAFRGLKRIKKLFLSNNYLRALPPKLLNWDQLEVLDLKNNPFRCDCGLLWLEDVLIKFNATIPALKSCCDEKQYTVSQMHLGADEGESAPKRKGIDMKLTIGLITGSVILFIGSIAFLLYKLKNGLCNPLYGVTATEILKDAEAPVHVVHEESEPMHKADSVEFTNGKTGSPYGSGDVTLL